MKLYIFIILTGIFLSSCGKENRDFEHALEIAGENRKELESVVDNYIDNPQKLEAAKWLIANMPGNSNPWSKTIQAFNDTIRKNVLSKQAGDSLWRSMGKEGHDYINQKDISTVSSSFLIKDIDKAFSTWKECPWHDEIDFDRFKKYVLPYRVSNELLCYGWRDSLYLTYYPIVKEIGEAKTAFEIIRKAVRNRYQEWAYEYPYAIDPIAMNNYVSGRCIDRCIYLASVCRAVGLPVAIDQVGLWTNYSNSSHSWVSLVLDDGTYTIVDDDSIAKRLNIIDASTFSLHDMLPDNYPYEPMMMKRYAKVWRNSYFNTYRSQDSVFYKGETVFNYNPKITDVSAFYGLNNIAVIESDSEIKTVSLDIFSLSKGWTPIVTKMRTTEKTVFINVADSVLFLPVGQSESRLKILGNPFYISDGEQIEIKTDTLRTINVTLRRKYPMIARWFNRYLRYRGASFIGSQFSDFHKSDTICSITDIPVVFNSIQVNNDHFYRYIQKISSNHGSSKLENIDIFDITGKTLYSGKEGIIDLGGKYQLSHITFIPWNDGNFITPGHKYELVYWDGNKWKSLCNKIAYEYQLIFDNIPASGLFLLHDQTEGKEERPFTIRNGKPIWW